MKDDHVEREWEIQGSIYYGGSVSLQLVSQPPYPGVVPRPRLRWTAYERGDFTLDLSWEEIENLVAALVELQEIDAVGLRDELLAGWNRAEALGAPLRRPR